MKKIKKNDRHRIFPQTLERSETVQVAKKSLPQVSTFNDFFRETESV